MEWRSTSRGSAGRRSRSPVFSAGSTAATPRSSRRSWTPESEPPTRALLLDFERVSFISSAGLRVGLRVGRRFKEPGLHFGICSLCDQVREVFAASGFDEIIPIYESQAAAIGEFQG